MWHANFEILSLCLTQQTIKRIVAGLHATDIPHHRFDVMNGA